MKRLLSICLLSLLLVACGRPAVGDQAATATSSLPPPVSTSSPIVGGSSSTPAPTYMAALVGISAPEATPTTVNQPLVVSPLVTKTIELRIGAQTVTVELASTPEQRERGFMARTQIPDNTGMLFVFPSDQNLSFWMRDTPLPLSIAFIDANQVILNVEDMQPFDDQTFHLSNGAARYALEVNQGWFTQHGIKAGDRVEFSLPADLDIR